MMGMDRWESVAGSSRRDVYTGGSRSGVDGSEGHNDYESDLVDRDNPSGDEDHGQPYFAGVGSLHSLRRGSLGKLIERSTSAPPTSLSSDRDKLAQSEGSVRSIHHPGAPGYAGGLSLVGGNVLEQLTRTYAEHGLKEHHGVDGYPIKAGVISVCDAARHQDLLSLLGTGSTSSGRSTAPSSETSASHHLPSGLIHSPGSLTQVRSSTNSLGDPINHVDNLSGEPPFPLFGEGLARSQSAAPFHTSLGEADLARSQSAAPSFVERFRSTPSRSAGYFDRVQDHDDYGDVATGLARSQSAAPYLSRLSQGELVRSQSAAPTFQGGREFAIIGPPPGLGGQPWSEDSRGSAGLQRRDSGAAALRPAPKKPMDLIQEDFPCDNAGDRLRTARTSPTLVADRRSVSDFQGSPHNQQQSVPLQGTHNIVQNGVANGDVHARSPIRPRQDEGLNVLQGPGRSVANGDHPARQSESHQPTFVSQQQQQASHQQLYYSGGHPAQGAMNIHQQGQAVYVNGPILPSQQQPNYGYATIHYNAPAQQRLSPAHSQPHPLTQIVHQQVQAGLGAHHEPHYISFVPIQGSGGAIPSQMTAAYWQQPEVVSSSAMHAHHAQHLASTATGMGQPPTLTLLNAQGPANLPSSRGPPLSPAMDLSPQLYGPRGTGHGIAGPGRARDKVAGGGGRGRRGGAAVGASSGRRGADPKQPICSIRMEEFRAMKNRDWTIHQISGYVVEFCQDQNGSRFIQQRLEMGDMTEQLVVAKEVLPAIRRLRNDVFGNYVVQKLLDFGSSQVRSAIRDTLEGELLQLSLQMYGCRVVQKALETLQQDDVSRLLIEFHHNVLSCIHDQNGNHVIQKCIEVVSKRAKKERCVGANEKADHLNKQISFIIDDVLFNTVALSCHPYGCRVLQRILEHCSEDTKERVLNEIRKCHRKLLDDQYGNYVIQHVLQYGRVVDRDAILSIVVDSGLLGLSRQKFASNVVEKLLKYGNDRHICTIVREMLKRGDDPALTAARRSSAAVSGGSDGSSIGCSVVMQMVRDAFANYVVQTTLDVVPESSDERRLLIQELNEHAEELRQYTFAKHIVAKLGSLNEFSSY